MKFMGENIQFSMELRIGLKMRDLYEAEELLGQVLNLNLESKDDLELGGFYFAYEPHPLPSIGVNGIRLRVNFVKGLGWSNPERKKLPLVAELGLSGTNLLELGRVAAVLTDACGDFIVLVEYNLSILGPREIKKEFWRAHWVEFSSDEQAAPRWNRNLGQHSTSSVSSPLSRDGFNQSHALLCDLTFGFESPDYAEAEKLTKSLFGVQLEERDDQWFGGRYLEYSRPDAAVGEITSLLVRPNALRRWTLLYPDRKEHKLLLHLTLDTPNLLELGRIAATLEAQCGDALQPVGYRVVGNFLFDGIPRMLVRSFTSKEDAAPQWHLGHERLEPEEDDDDEEWWDEDEDEEQELYQQDRLVPAGHDINERDFIWEGVSVL